MVYKKNQWFLSKKRKELQKIYMYLTFFETYAILTM